jgi:hypothetical protein
VAPEITQSAAEKSLCFLFQVILPANKKRHIHWKFVGDIETYDIIMVSDLHIICAHH